MRSEVIHRIESQEVPQDLPPRAEAAGAARGADVHQTIAWVGQQHLIHGYCGRARTTPVAADSSVVVAGEPARAMARRTRSGTVRVGPKPVATSALGRQAKAA